MKNLFLGLALAAVAVGGSAFTNASNKLVDPTYAWDGTAFVLIDSYTQQSCNSGDEFHCAYVVTPAGAAVITPGMPSITETLGASYISDATPKLVPLQRLGSDVPLGIYTP